MAYITGKQAFVQILKQEGVSVMFGNPGTTESPLMDGLAREPGIHYVLALRWSTSSSTTRPAGS
jgi:benzoylformate decarboxylase